MLQNSIIKSWHEITYNAGTGDKNTCDLTEGLFPLTLGRERYLKVSRIKLREGQLDQECSRKGHLTRID